MTTRNICIVVLVYCLSVYCQYGQISQGFMNQWGNPKVYQQQKRIHPQQHGIHNQQQQIHWQQQGLHQQQQRVPSQHLSKQDTQEGQNSLIRTQNYIKAFTDKYLTNMTVENKINTRKYFESLFSKRAIPDFMQAQMILFNVCQGIAEKKASDKKEYIKYVQQCVKESGSPPNVVAQAKRKIDNYGVEKIIKKRPIGEMVRPENFTTMAPEKYEEIPVIISRRNL